MSKLKDKLNKTENLRTYSYIKNGTFYTEIESQDATNYIIFVHGWNSDSTKDTNYAKKLAKHGFNSLTFDLKGFGKSSGNLNEVTRKEHVDELSSIIESKSLIDFDSVTLIGSSYGAYIAACVSNKYEFSNIVLRVPQLYPNDGYKQPKVLLQGDTLKTWRSKLHNKKDLYPLIELDSTNARIGIVSSGTDKYVHLETINSYRKAAGSKHVYFNMKNSRHSLKTESDFKEYIEILRSFLC